MKELKPYQLDAIKYLAHNETANHPGGLLFMDPGTGKTLSVITYVRQRRYIQRILIICRRDDFLTWQIELGHNLNATSIERTHFIDEHEDLVEVLKTPLDHNVDRSWIITSYGRIRNKESNYLIRCTPFDMVICDESHCIKRWDSQQTKAAIKATRHIRIRVAMTGTALSNDVACDTFPQMLFWDNGATLGSNYWAFRNTYYIRSGFGWYLRRGAADRIRSCLARVAFHVKDDDVLKLPPVVRVIKCARMTPRQRSRYMKLIREWELKIDDHMTVEIDFITSIIVKLRQLASGFIYDDQNRPIWVSTSKLDLLNTIVTDQDLAGQKPKVVIWCAHVAEIDRICEMFKPHAVSFYGSDRKAKAEARQRFNRDPSVRFFVAQVDSGVGMNELTVADTAIYFNNSYRVVSRLQSTRRIRRIGSEHHHRITYYDLVTQHTIDETILTAVTRNINLVSYMLSAIRSGHSLSRTIGNM